MGGIGDELTLLGKGLVEPVEHVVEGIGEDSQLGRIAGVRAQPRGEVAGVDLARGLGKVPQRRGGAGGEQIAGEERRDQGRTADREEGLLDVGLGIADRGDRGTLLTVLASCRRRPVLMSLLALDHRGLVGHLGADGDEDDGEGEDDYRADRERQPAAQAHPPPAATHFDSRRR